MSLLGYFFPELAGWRCLKETSIKDRSNLQLLPISVPVFFIFCAASYPLTFEFLIFFFFSLIYLLACFDRCHNNSCAEIMAFKTEIEAFFEYLSSFLMNTSFVFV